MFQTIYLGEPDKEESDWIYQLSFAHTGGGIMKSQDKILVEQVYSREQGRYLLDRTSKSEGEDEETLKYIHMEQATANKEFRTVQSFFQNIEYLNIVPQLPEFIARIQRSKRGAAKGPEYNSAILPYIQNKWNIDEACKQSDSLSRMVKRIKNIIF